MKRAAELPAEVARAVDIADIVSILGTLCSAAIAGLAQELRKINDPPPSFQVVHPEPARKARR